ncbi:MAG TPA: zf-HC2 domain-containing protein, partial [Thermoanaerobaculia bacterium]|nr:zf-HC2 domain-containing protein [Thermoanaerobaculia bacterium]
MTITCRQLIDFIAAYVADELDDAARGTFERHLSGCSSCRAYLQTYQQALMLAQGALDQPLEDAPEDLVRTILG